MIQTIKLGEHLNFLTYFHLREVESLQCEMSGYISSIEALKMEIMELQAQLDAERDGNIDQVKYFHVKI